MTDSWEDDWETEAEQVIAGVKVDDVDESKFEGEDEGVGDDWDADVPAPQPKKVVLSKYSARDQADAARAASMPVIDGSDPVAVRRAQEEAELRMMAEAIGVDATGGPEVNPLDAMVPKSNADFEKYAKDLVDRYGILHAKAKQYKFFVKQIVKLLCEPLDSDSTKDVETSLAGIRSEKVKAERERANANKKGGKKSVKVESTALDDYTYDGFVGVDDDEDFM